MHLCVCVHFCVLALVCVFLCVGAGLDAMIEEGVRRWQLRINGIAGRCVKRCVDAIVTDGCFERGIIWLRLQVTTALVARVCCGIYAGVHRCGPIGAPTSVFEWAVSCPMDIL